MIMQIFVGLADHDRIVYGGIFVSDSVGSHLWSI
jgi:hypothetical protein